MSEKNQNEKENNSNNKPIIKCIFCEKLETQFRHSKIQQKFNSKNSLDIETINKRKESRENITNNSNESKSFIKSKYSIGSKDKENKEEYKKPKKLKKIKNSISAINIINNEEKEDEKINEEESKPKNKKIKLKVKSTKKLKKKKTEEEESPEDSGVEAEPNSRVQSEEEEEHEPEYEEDQNIATLPVMLTNLDNSYDKYHKNFDTCGHAICYNCIARLIFTSHLNELPSYEDIKLSCKCNKGSIQISIDELDLISSKLNLPVQEKICDKHGLIQIKFCLECKKYLCKKCIESHVDLFGENLHHLEDESPPHNDLCKEHPTCFLDTLCNDCHKTICHLCLVEGNKHFCHNAVSFNSLKLNIIKNVENMKFSNYDLFLKGIDDLNNIYENLYNEEIKKFTDQIDTLIENINEYKI